jgi:hypothetical protein
VVLAIEAALAVRTASEAGTFREVAEGTGMPLVEATVDSTDRTLAPAAAVVLPAWGAAAEVVAGVRAADGAGKR